jgi:hypothetical protein
MVENRIASSRTQLHIKMYVTHRSIKDSNNFYLREGNHSGDGELRWMTGREGAGEVIRAAARKISKS